MSDEITSSIKSDDSVGSSVLASHPTLKREKSDPQAGNEPVSLWAIVICAVALVSGGSYLGSTNGGFDYDNYQISGYEPHNPAGGSDVVEIKDPFKEWIKAGKGVYSTTCIGCHQASGMGAPGTYPPLAKSEWVVNGTERFAQIVLKGLHGPIEVNGQAFGSVDMPPHGEMLKDKQIAQVMSYVRYEFENGIEGIENIVTEEMVAEARKRHSGHAGFFTVSELAPADSYLPGAAPASPSEGTVPAETPAK